MSANHVRFGSVLGADLIRFTSSLLLMLDSLHVRTTYIATSSCNAIHLGESYIVRELDAESTTGLSSHPTHLLSRLRHRVASQDSGSYHRIQTAKTSCRERS